MGEGTLLCHNVTVAGTVSFDQLHVLCVIVPTTTDMGQLNSSVNYNSLFGTLYSWIYYACHNEVYFAFGCTCFKFGWNSYS